ncbi:hypothetical protein [Pectobacterium carotovorum]|nr:hypothetical protein [Pectobacterium carotovorum]MDK9422044.1 hypothetical protein [Pectobacterium carotovorum]
MSRSPMLPPANTVGRNPACGCCQTIPHSVRTSARRYRSLMS